MKEYLIQEIIDSCPHGRGYQYLVQWMGYSHKHNCWLASLALKNCEAQQWLQAKGLDADTW
jgi:hypothetical protein